MRWNKYILIALAAMLLPTFVAADDVIWFLYENSNNHHKKYVTEGEASLREAIPGIKIRHAGDERIKLSATPGDRVLIISVGAKGAQQAVQYGLPTLNTLITRRSFISLKESYNSPVSSIFLDQPVNRYLQLIKASLPQRTKLTVLIGSGTQTLASELKQQADSLGIGLRLITINENDAINRLFGQELLAEDTLLLLPDPAVVNRRTVKPLVLGSYRHGIPLVGYSQALVKAGALMAIHSSTQALEEEMVESVKHYFAKRVLPAPRYTDDFEVSVNYQLARALKVSLPSEETLKRKLQERLR